MEIVSHRGVNGAIFHCLLLTRELVRRGHKVTLVCYADSWIADQAAGDDVEIVLSDLHRWPTDELRRIAAIVREKKIDVVHTHTSRSHFFGVLLRWAASVPSVATAHSCHFQLHWMFNDHVIACSEATRRYHRTYNLVRPSRIQTVRTFIDYGRMAKVSDGVRAATRTAFGIGASSYLIGTVGSLIPRKGSMYLIQALPKILAAVPDTRLMLVGTPGPDDYMHKIKSTAEQLGVASQIIWTGHRDDVDAIMTALDVFVLPSLDEPLGMSTLEAMAAGLPVVATSVGGVPECVEHGVTGTLVPPANSAALGEAIVAMLRDPSLRRRFGRAGRKRVLENFSPESQTARIEHVFEHVVGRRRAA